MDNIDNNTDDNNNPATATDPSEVAVALQSERDALLNKNKELLGDLSALKALKRQIEDMGGVETIANLVSESEAARQKELEATTNVVQLKDHFNEQIEAERNKNSQLVNGIVDNYIDSQLRSAVTKNKGSYELLEHKLRQQVKGEYVDGKVQISVVDASGMPLMVEGKDAALGDLVESFKANEAYARAFDGVANVSGSNAPVGGKTVINAEASTLTEISELYKKNPARAMEVMKAKGLV